MMPTPIQLLTMMGTIRDAVRDVSQFGGTSLATPEQRETAYATINRALDEWHDPIRLEAEKASRSDPAKAPFAAGPHAAFFRDHNLVDIEIGARVRRAPGMNPFPYDDEPVVMGLGNEAEADVVYCRFDADDLMRCYPSRSLVVSVMPPPAEAVDPFDTLAERVRAHGQMMLDTGGGSASRRAMGAEFLALAETIRTGEPKWD